MKSGGLALALSFCSLTACAAPPPDLQLTSAQWRADLQVLGQELPRRHLNAFHAVSKAQFDAAVAALDQRIPSLDGDQVFVGMEKIARLIGDGHTGLHAPADAADLPLRIQRFGDAWRVTATAPGAEAALGARVTAVGGVPIAQAHALMLAVTPSDESAELRDALADMRLTTGLYLHGLGLTPDRNHARFDLLADDGRAFSFDATALAAGAAPPVWRHPWSAEPLNAQHPADPLWCVRVAAGTAIYCDFRSYQGLGGPAGKLRDELKASPPDRLIIDLRHNGGGDYFVGLNNLVDPIAAMPTINRKGHLFVLTGVLTFSAAMSNSAQFRQRTNAILAGEAIGERPNSYQENRELTLPNSHIVVSYSTRFYRFVPDGAENRVRPDLPVETGWDDYKAGRDPVLEQALSYKAP
jgi:hypothetical protein